MLFGFAVVLSGITACGSAPHPTVRTDFVPFGAEELAARDLAKHARYRLRPGDVFSVDFKYEDDLDQHGILVLPDGFFTIYGMHALPAAGLNVDQLDSLLTAEFGKDYRDPDLSVVINTVAAQQIFVFGEVKLPGAYKIEPGMGGILQAVALAGGFSQHAKKDELLVVRVAENGFLYRRCDVSQLHAAGIQQVDFLDLQPNDVVYVPKSSLGNLSYFGETILANLLRVSDLFWDVYAIANIDKVERIVR
ncbi:MAG: polysaccharide biosynthesis/export family protein [bacterium]|nr:polysaccharide biosynthesis/export family protein [bacterium]